METWEKELFEKLDMAMKAEDKRMKKLVDIARKKPKAFTSHVWKVLSRIKKVEYHTYAKMVKTTAIPVLEDEKNSLKWSSKGVSVYLHWKLTAKDYFTVADAAGIDEDILKQLIQKRAEEIYPPRKKKEKQDTHDYKTIATDTHKLPNDRDTMMFFKQKEKHTRAGKIKVTENPAPKKGTKKTYSVISFGNQKGLALYHVYNAFDKSIMGAVYSLKKAGNDVTTIDILYTHINGKEGRIKAPPAMRKKMLDSLRAMGSTWVVIEFDTENQYHYENSKIRYEGNLLEIRIKKAYVNGNLVEDAIIINGFSPFVEVAEMKNQILEYPKKLLDVPVSCTEETIIMREELLRRIYNMKNHGQTKVIVLEEAFEQIGYKGKTPRDRGRILDKAYKMMDYWKEQGHIFGYEVVRKGQTPYSIEVKPCQPKKVK